MVKRLFAVGAGVTMLGATAMGAMAADLGTYPTMFVKDGTFNGFFVVGENAAAVDNLAMTDIAAAMKYNKPTDTTMTTVEGDNWQVGTVSKKLEMANTNSTAVGEQVYDIEQFIGKAELAALADGTYSTSGTSSGYVQYLYFDVKNNAENEIVKFVENDNDITGDFFYVKSSTNIGEYVLEFSSAPESTIQNTAGSANTAGEVLDDFENTQVTMLGKVYDIVLARRPGGGTNSGDAEDTIKLTMMGGSVRGSLLEGDSTTLETGGKSYEVTLTFVDETYAKFLVNGEQTDKLQVGDTYKLSDGIEVGLAERLYQSYAGGVHSADFFLGASKIELKDTDVASAAAGASTLKVGSETISGADVNIEGTDDNTTFTLSKIRINMTAQDDYYVPVGGKLSASIVEQGDDKELLFTNNWDFEYLGLTDEETHDISLIASTDRRFKLRFWDGDNNQVDLPLVYANTSTELLMSEEATEKEVILNEALNISKNDYFVVSAGTAAQGTAKTFALQYKGADKNSATSPKIKFKNLGSGETLEYAVDSGTSSTVATIKLGGYSFAVKNITTSSKDSSDFVINVDLNGDGTLADDAVTSAEVDIVDYYGMQIDFGNTLYRHTNGVQLNNPLGNATFVKQIQMNWTDPDTNSYDDQAPPIIYINVSATTTNEVTIGVFQTDSTSNPSLTPEGEENIGYGYTTMGAKWTYTTPSGSPNEFKYEYPENQRLPQVYVTSGAVSSSTSSGGDLVAVEVIDATKLDSEIASASAQNLIVVGGPCVNTVAAELLGNPADCTQGFTPGKARVKLFENANGNMAMLVAGYSGADTRLAGKVIAHRAKEMSGGEVEVSGTTYTDATIGAPAVVAVEAASEEPAATE